MQNHATKISLVLLSILYSFSLFSFNGTVRYSDGFYAAQKYFYQEAKLKYAKIKGDKTYPEIPIRGSVKDEELDKIEALQDYFEARRIFLEEAAKYPEQIYPEVFSFLSNHPAQKLSPSNKAKFAATEVYFSAFFALFSTDKHYAFHSELKQIACPLIFCLSDMKKNSLSFKLYNTSKTNYDFNCLEFPNQSYVKVDGKLPVKIKGGGTATIKVIVDLVKLKVDSTFKTLNLIFSDPTQPRVKIIVPVILLPGKEFLNLYTQLYDLNFNYSTFFKHISLQKEKSSWPEACPNGDCSGKKAYSLRSQDRSYSTYAFNDLCGIQYNLNTQTSSTYNLKSNTYKLQYHEIGTIAGEGRNCVDLKTGMEIHCADDTPNNGKEIYGSRKIEWKLLVANGSTSDLLVNLNYFDLPNMPEQNSELSWLQEKVLAFVVNDASGKQIFKQLITRNQSTQTIKNLVSGIYSIELFPVTEDGKLKPSFNIQHLNHGGKSRFDFTLNMTLQVMNHVILPVKK